MNASSTPRAHATRDRARGARGRPREWLRLIADALEDRQLELVVDLEWFAQAIDGVPSTVRTCGAIDALRARLEQLVLTTQALHAVQCDAHDPHLAQLFATEAPIAAYVDAIYGFCEAVTVSMLAVARGLRRGDAVWTALPRAGIGRSIARVDLLARAVCEERIALRARGEPFARLGEHLDALAQATSWLHARPCRR